MEKKLCSDLSILHSFGQQVSSSYFHITMTVLRKCPALQREKHTGNRRVTCLAFGH